MPQPLLDVDQLTKRFGGVVALDAVSLNVPERAVYGFLGRNGAGKTTTLKMVLGLIAPSAGSVRVCGIDVVRDRLAAARRIGALLEAHGFYVHLTGRQNLALTATLLGAPPTEIDRVLEVVELRGQAERRVSDYSLGMRQRLGLARAMLNAPPVLILDEPTNGLDPDGIADMRRFLRSLPERTGATVLLSSHLLGEIEQTATHSWMAVSRVAASTTLPTVARAAARSSVSVGARAGLTDTAAVIAPSVSSRFSTLIAAITASTHSALAA